MLCSSPSLAPCDHGTFEDPSVKLTTPSTYSFDEEDDEKDTDASAGELSLGADVP